MYNVYMVLKALVIIPIILVSVLLLAWGLIEGLISLHDFLDAHGIQCRSCIECDRELGRVRKTPRLGRYDY